MNLDELSEPSGLLSQFQQISDDPFLLILFLGGGAFILVAILLKLAFASMKRADNRQQKNS